ncbi:MAG: ribose 5-phosphate isomerase B [archaeon]
MKLYLGADHAGFKLKLEVKKLLASLRIPVDDFSPIFKEGDDYPKYAELVASAVFVNKAKGILICGSGIGMDVVANKFPGVRAALCLNKDQAKMSREAEDSNILVLSQWFIEDNPKEILEAWLNSKFEGGRHRRRLDEIEEIEKKIQKLKIFFSPPS